MFSYNAYGLRISSEIPLLELTSEQFQTADITIRIGSLEVPVEDVKTIGSYEFSGEHQVAYFQNQGIGKFWVRCGREIVVDPEPGIDEKLLGLATHEGAIALLLFQRGYLLLHASVAVMNDQAVVFLGDSGRGKSTTVAALCNQGYEILTDDLAVVDMSNPQHLTILSGTPQINLLPSSVTALGYDNRDLPLIHPFSEKRIHHAGNNFPDRRYLLKRIYLLDYADCLEITPLAPQAAFISLLQNSYGLQIFRHIGNLSTYMSQWQTLIHQVGVYALKRIKSLDNLPDIVIAIEKDVSIP